MTFIADDASISLNELTLRSLITIPLLFALAANDHVEMRRIATAESAALMVVFIVYLFLLFCNLDVNGGCLVTIRGVK